MSSVEAILAAIEAGHDTPEKLARITGLKVNSVRRNLSSMARLGLVRHLPRAGFNTPKSWTIATADDLETIGDDDMEPVRRIVSAHGADSSVVRVALDAQPMLGLCWSADERP